MSCKPHDNIPLAHLLWITYICVRKCCQNLATWVMKKRKKERCDLVLAVAIIWVIISKRESLQKQQDLNQKTQCFLLHLAGSVSYIQLQRLAWTTGSKFGWKSALFAPRNKRWGVQMRSYGDHLLLVVLLQTWVWLVGSYLPKQTAPSGENNLGLDSIKLNERWRTRTASYVSE